MIPDQLVEELKNKLGDNLLSVILFGSGARGDATRRFSNVNILVVVKDLRLPAIKTAAPVFARWVKAGNPFPLLFSEKNLRQSGDVFPVEFMDIVESNRVLFGANPFLGLILSKENLRHQLEFELRSKALQLRQRYLESDGKSGALFDLMARSFSSLSALFKAVVWMRGRADSLSRQEIWTILEQSAPIDRAALETILLIRQGNKAAQKVDADDLFNRYFASVEAVIEYVNNFKSQ